MIENLFKGVFDTAVTETIASKDFLICVFSAIIIGVALSVVTSFKSRPSKSFMLTVAVLPAIVCVVIMMVNGNIGAGVAVAGAFSLVRFRSAPGTAKEIAVIFLAMGAGLVVGMGYIGYAVLFTLILGGFLMLLTAVNFGEAKNESKEKILKITLPEGLNFTELFDDVLKEYTKSYVQTSVKTSAMGSLYKIKYNIIMNSNAEKFQLLEEIRCRNGNMEVQLYDRESEINEL